MPLLAHLDQATGLPVRKPKPVRYEAAAPSDLVHVDIKKLGKIADGGGGASSAAGPSSIVALVPRPIEQPGSAPASRDYVHLHHAVDDH